MSQKKKEDRDEKGAVVRPVLVNAIVILLIGFIGIWIVYLSIALFTKHGQSDTVPGVENLSYTQAVARLEERGFRVDIRDSVYSETVKPGYVIEQFPKSGSIVKPGRKIFLYINAVNPKQVVIDEDNNPREDALRSFSFRQGMARLEELGFKNIRVVRVLGDNDCIVKVTANGRTVKKTERVPVNANIVVEVYDGRLQSLRDSLQRLEYDEYMRTQATPDYGGETDYGYGYDDQPENPAYSRPARTESAAPTQRESEKPAPRPVEREKEEESSGIFD